jgi:hypothetical protein
MNARTLGAACAGAAGAALLHVGGAAWSAAVLAGAGTAAFMLLRTVPGVWVAFGVLLAAAFAAWTPQPNSSMPLSLLPWLGGLEVYGLATIAAVRAVREPVQISRRLLGAWLASTGAIVLGLALSCDAKTTAMADALVTFGIMYKLGVVPAYAWAPMLVRHPSPRIMAAGVAGFAIAYAVLLNVVPLLPDRADAAMTVIMLSAATVPWAAWQAWRQWRRDPRCARTYAVIALIGASLLLWQVTHVAG